MLLCSCCENFEGIGVRIEEEKKTTVIWELIDDLKPYTALFLLWSLSKMSGGLLLMKFVSKCVFWVYFASILRVFEHFLISYDERSFGSRGSVVDAESDYIDYIVYGCSIVDENCEISESEMSQFWPYSAYPRLLRMHRRIIVDKISE